MSLLTAFYIFGAICILTLIIVANVEEKDMKSQNNSVSSKIQKHLEQIIFKKSNQERVLQEAKKKLDKISNSLHNLDNPNENVLEMANAQIKQLEDKVAFEQLLLDMINRKEYLLNQASIELELVEELKKNALNQQDASQISKNYEQLSADISVLLNVDYDAELLKRLKGTSNQNEYEFERQRLEILKELELETDKELRTLNNVRQAI